MGNGRFWPNPGGEVLHREVFTLRSFCTQTSRSLYTQKLLHEEVVTQIYSFLSLTDAFTHRSFYTEKPLHREFYTRKLLHTVKSLHRRAFTHRSFHTQKLLHKEVFIHKVVFTQKLLHISFYTAKSLHRGAFTRSNQLKLAAVVRDKLLAGAFGNSLAPQKSRLFPTKFLFHELFKKNIRNFFLKQVPIQKLSSPHCDEMEGREIRRSRRGASALKIILYNSEYMYIYIYIYTY